MQTSPIAFASRGKAKEIGDVCTQATYFDEIPFFLHCYKTVPQRPVLDNKLTVYPPTHLVALEKGFFCKPKYRAIFLLHKFHVCFMYPNFLFSSSSWKSIFRRRKDQSYRTTFYFEYFTDPGLLKIQQFLLKHLVVEVSPILKFYKIHIQFFFSR